ncbi:MAG: response regulator [Chloroflexi bacterium]|nr:response regulator [Chloroflexota bacterium]MCI0644427.1 response regulator [Chloroflexota bacterium]MCI0725408.1 response regulator [Chloroflexota bacterium]
MAKVLVIEDNPTNLELMTYLLQAFGHVALTAAEGAAGLEIARREAVDLIICDVQLPGIDGYEVVRQLKNHPALRHVPVVAVTAFAMVGDRDRVLAAGFDGYMAKPIEPETFVQQVEGFLRNARRGAPKPASQPPPAPRADRRATILVVDNTAVNLEVIRTTLEPFGYAVVAAHTVPEALALARANLPDLILSDVHMPVENGFDFIRATRADPQLSNIPFVFISSSVWLDSDRRQGLELGAARFIARPIEPQQLLEEIELCLQHGNHSDR